MDSNKQSEIDTNIYTHVYEDTLKLHEKYSYIKIKDLVEIYYAGMNRIWAEIRPESDITTVSSENVKE